MEPTTAPIASTSSAQEEATPETNNTNNVKLKQLEASDELSILAQQIAQHQTNEATPTSTNQHHNHHQRAQSGNQWMLVAAQTTQGVRQRMSFASDQIGQSLRQFYASASTIADVPPSYHNIPGIVPYYHGRASGPPPSYDDVVNPYAPPPTYQSLFGQMREARKTSRGIIDLLKRLLIIILSTIGCTLLIAFMILIPFTMIIVGAVYIDDCRVEHIPAFLLIGGLVWAVKNVIHCYAQCHRSSTTATSNLTPSNSPSPINIGMQSTQRDETRIGETSLQSQQDFRLKSSICESLLNCVLVGWFIAGCVIVFRNYEPEFENTNSSRYCNRIVYMYTFWLVTSAIIIFSLFISCICCLMVSSAVSSRQSGDDASDLA